jgi:hypothetical protein
MLEALSITTILAQSSSNTGGGLAGILMALIYIAILVVVIAGLWKTFVKGGQPGWAAIVPIYNIYCLCKIVGRPGWWTILFFIPFVSIVFAIIVSIDLAKSFGKSIAFAIGLILLSPVFFCILGFGSAQYNGPAAAAPQH